MNYFQAYLPSLDEAIVAAWDSQLAEAAEAPWLAKSLAAKSAELFPRFAARYAELRALPRGARRALQRQLARSGDLAISSEWRQKLAGSIAGAALLLALGQGTAQAVDITVNTANPAVNPGDNKCSLIEAILNANTDSQFGANPDCPAGSGADVIKLPAGTITLPSGYGASVYGSATGLPVITSPITIEGKNTKIVRKPNDPDLFRILAVGATGDLALNKVGLSGGRSGDTGGAVHNNGILTVDNSTISGNSALAYGGGIFNAASKTLTVEKSKIVENKAHAGGGIYNFNGTVSIEDATISRNSAAHAGGGVYNDDSGAMTIERSTISLNKAGVLGGGVINLSNSFMIQNSTISSNSAGFVGGGILNEPGATATIEYCTVTRNTAYDSGGGVFNNNTITIENSTISLNRALTGGGGGFFNNDNAVATIDGVTFSKNKGNDGGGIFTDNDSSLTIANSTISGNKGTGGGGVFIDDNSTVTITNSTISSNTATEDYGGGLYVDNGANVTLNNTTVSGNKAKVDAGGIANDGILNLNRSLISGNKAPVAREMYNYMTGVINADNFNIIGFGGNHGVVYSVGSFTPGATDIVPTESLPKIIGPLKLNAPGATKTHALATNSPAIDAIPAADPGCVGTPTDQRGVTRPQGADCDIGAFEKDP
jgi:parallel beta-helix repeat protein